MKILNHLYQIEFVDCDSANNFKDCNNRRCDVIC